MCSNVCCQCACFEGVKHNGNIAPLILILGTQWRWGDRIDTFNRGERTLLPSEW